MNEKKKLTRFIEYFGRETQVTILTSFTSIGFAELDIYVCHVTTCDQVIKEPYGFARGASNHKSPSCQVCCPQDV